MLKALIELGPTSLGLYALYRLGLRTGRFRREPDLARLQGRLPADLHSVFSFPDSGSVLKTIRQAGRTSTLSEADEVVRGRVRLFGGAPRPLVLTFEGPLRHWIDYETGATELPLQKGPRSRSVTAQPADIKFLWEPARFGWAFSLGRAYHLSRKEKYAEAFWKYFARFDEGNPPYLGPHWMNGQEVAIRLMALVWCAQAFAPAKASSPGRKHRLVRSIAEHAARIPPTLIYARSQNNNHLVTESAALYTAGAAFEYRPWRDLGWHWLNYALQHQISTYGEYIQHSTNYHRLMLQTALWVDAVRRGRRGTWPAETLSALMRASHWLFSMLDPESGHVPNLGANDGSLGLPLSSMPFDDYRPTVQAAARAFLRTGLPAGRWDDLSLWLALPAAKHTADSAAYAADQLRGRRSWAHLRASSFKSRLSHMDQLHFDLWWHGLNLTPDAGTYLYNGDPPWGNSLVTTRVHNTIMVDGRDQMTRAGRFLTLDWGPAFSQSVLAADPHLLGRMQASFGGYRRLGVRHERLASVYDDRRWKIEDRLILTKPGDHVFRLHWLLLDGDWHLQETGRDVRLRLRLPRGWMSVTISGQEFSGLELRPTMVRAGEILHGPGRALAYEGWVSPTYGQKVPALSLAVESQSTKSCRFITQFVLPA